MTTADNARKEAAFLYYDVPKKDQPVFDDEMKKHCGRMSADHISILMKLLEPMTTNWVLLRVADDYPICVIGKIGEDTAAAYIAPMIDEDFNS